jgi:hypothetical protein
MRRCKKDKIRDAINHGTRGERIWNGRISKNTCFSVLAECARAPQFVVKTPWSGHAPTSWGARVVLDIRMNCCPKEPSAQQAMPPAVFFERVSYVLNTQAV